MLSVSKLFPALAVAAALALTSCASAPAQTADVSKITSTTSFGMCVGYCTTTLEITEGQAVFTREARGGRGAPSNLPPQVVTQPLSDAEWREIAALAANTNLSALPDRIGCPDCADGGAETLTLGARTITFDHGAEIAQAKPLLDRVRALRTRLMPAE